MLGDVGGWNGGEDDGDDGEGEEEEEEGGATRGGCGMEGGLRVRQRGLREARF